ncbi:hypothetical protein FHS15_004367 [Paenibacillus castaneae]|nr:hypothetical protein [Paenibacillus castaneae]
MLVELTVSKEDWNEAFGSGTGEIDDCRCSRLGSKTEE